MSSIALDFPRRALRDFMHRIEVPRDIAEVTDTDADNECDPLEAGIAHKEAAAIWDAVEGLYRTGYYPTILFCLRRQGKVVFNRAIGHARGNGPGDEADTPKLRATVRTPSCIFSASKGISAMVMHRMEEQGQLNLLNPISHYIPEFAKHGKERTTIYHLLSHRAGIPGIAGVDDPQVVLDHEQCLQLLCDAEPQHLLGRQQAYHAITGGVILNEIVRRVSGMDMRKAWRTWFKEPMGFKVLDYGAAGPLRARIAEQTLTGIQNCSVVDGFLRDAIGAKLSDVAELLNDPGFYQAIIPSGNMVSTAEEAAAFYQMLLDGGRWNGRQILRPETIVRATMEVGPHQFDRTVGVPLRFSQGFMLGGAPFGLYGPRTHHAFGHVGLVNNITWADPERQISVALLVSGIPLLAGNLPALGRLIIRIARGCPRVEP
jgi:CubicO group peptidase (beta-lactamase class C family)